MNKAIGYILASGVSALLGGVGGYFLAKKKLQNKFDEELTAAINNEIATIRESNEKREAKKEETLKKTTIEVKETATTLKEEAVKAINESPYSSQTEYDRLCKKVEEAGIEIPEGNVIEFEDVDDDDVQDIMGPNGWGKIGPKVVSIREYDELPPYFTKFTFKYFEGDDTLIDEADNIVDDIELMVGDALNQWEDGPGQKLQNFMYVVNGKLGMAIEIERHFDSYADWAGVK